MIKSRIIFIQAAANGTDMVSTTLDVEAVERLLRVADRNSDRFITVPTGSHDPGRSGLATVPLANIAFVRSI